MSGNPGASPFASAQPLDRSVRLADRLLGESVRRILPVKNKTNSKYREATT